MWNRIARFGVTFLFDFELRRFVINDDKITNGLIVVFEKRDVL